MNLMRKSPAIAVLAWAFAAGTLWACRGDSRSGFLPDGAGGPAETPEVRSVGSSDAPNTQPDGSSDPSSDDLDASRDAPYESCDTAAGRTVCGGQCVDSRMDEK